MIISKDWIDYQCLDSGEGEKLERWGKVTLRRPDPQIIWKKRDREIWKKADAIYHRSNQGGGYWEFGHSFPEKWTISYKDLTFKVSPTNFKHTGIFPEQAANWDFVRERIKRDRVQNKDFKVLNLFAYTGCATMAAAKGGADEVVHVDASKGMVNWAKDNMNLCHLEDKRIRFIVDDVIKFLEREKRRGRRYDGIIIMDPPSYGRGPKGEVWRLEDNLGELLEKVREIMEPDFSFLLINSYTTGLSPTALNNVLRDYFGDFNIETGEIGLPIVRDDMVLPCGIYGRVCRY